MAEPQEIQAAMTGFPRALKWDDFPRRTRSPSPPMEAQTGARISMNPGVVRLVDGDYRFRGARVTVSLDPRDSWAIASARSNSSLLQHEQGHYDITGLIARDWISDVLDLTLSEVVVDSVRDSGQSPQAKLNYVTRSFNKSVREFTDAATTLLNRLQTNPTTGADGLYDVETGHSQNATGQAEWDKIFQRIKGGREGFALWLKISGKI